MPKLMPFGSLLIPATKDQERQTVPSPGCRDHGPGQTSSVYTLRRLTTQKFRTRNGTELQLELCLLHWLPLSSPSLLSLPPAICTPCCGISLLYVILLQRFFIFFFACFSSLTYFSFSLSLSLSLTHFLWGNRVGVWGGEGVWRARLCGKTP